MAKNTTTIKTDPYAAYNRMKTEAHTILNDRIKVTAKKNGVTLFEAERAVRAQINERRKQEALQHAVREHMAKQQPRGYASIGEILAAKMAKEA